MTYIRMVRHGETDYNIEKRTQGWVDISLNEKGKIQAKEAIPRLREIHWDLMMTSPLKRATETASIIQKKLSIPLHIMEEVKERHYGDVEGMLREERKRRFPNNTYPNSETRDDVIQRVSQGFDQLNQLYPGKNILIISHGGAINAALTAYSNGVHGFDRTTISNLSFTDFQYQEDRWIISSVNKS